MKMIIVLDLNRVLVMQLPVVILISAILTDLTVIVVKDTFLDEVVPTKKSLYEVFPTDIGFFS